MKSEKKTRKQLQQELAKCQTEHAKEKLMRMVKGWQRERIRIERRNLETIINCLPNGVSVISDDFKVLYQNKWLDERFGRNAWHICHRKYLKRNQPCVNCFLKRAINHNRIEEGELETKDGRYYLIIAAPLGKLEGKVSGIEVLIDITEKRLAEKLAVKTQEKYIDLINSLNVGVYQTTSDPDGHFVEANPALISMLGAKSRSELSKHTVVDFYGDQSKRKKIINRALKFGFVKDEEVEFNTLKGKKFWSAITLAKKEDADGNVYLNGILEDISKRKQYEEELKHLSLNDELTGVYNRRGFFTLVEHQLRVANRHKTKAALFYFDLNNLKSINDIKGHEEGDRALINIATVIKNASRESDIVGRIGGDEFAMLAIGIGNEAPSVFTDRLRVILNQHNEEVPRLYNLSIAIGTAYYDYKQPCSLSELLSRADKSMYEQKKAGSFPVKKKLN